LGYTGELVGEMVGEMVGNQGFEPRRLDENCVYSAARPAMSA
jgi:hypothetical protein